MTVARTVSDLREVLARAPRPVGFVPTMGALHRGHLALVEQAVVECPTVVVSIYVNPTQFGPHEDFTAYPRPEADDLSLLSSTGTAVVFLPTNEEMYPGRETMVKVGGAALGFEGDSRPGHFDGVATVVAKLFLMTSCDVAYFGLKDLQQCAVVRQMTNDLSFRVRLRFLETVREESGLALSSRNQYFVKEQAELAATLYRILQNTGRSLLSGTSVSEACAIGKKALESNGFQPDYLDLVDPSTMKSVTTASPDAHLIVAANVFGVRLIDNLALRSIESA